MALRVRKDEKDGAVRLGWGDGEYINTMSMVTDNPGKVFAVIGPFDTHMDKLQLQDALLLICRGYNVKSVAR